MPTGVLRACTRGGLGHPLLDVGNFLAHMSARESEYAGTADHARASFLDACAAHRPAAQKHALLFEAVGLLKLAVGPFRRLEHDWPFRVEQLVGLTAQRLAEHERQRGHR